MAIKASYLFRPLSRPSSPAPPPTPPATPANARSDTSDGRTARPHTKLSLSTFRKGPLAVSPARPVTGAVPEGSYLETLSLKFSEAVSKALTQPVAPAGVTDALGARRPLPAGRGKAFGQVITSELGDAADNLHLRRAVIRALHRPLSVLLNMLSSHIVPLVASPHFSHPAAPTVQQPNNTPTQLHALAFAAFAGELLEAFDDLGLGVDVPGDVRGDGLKLIREGLSNLVTMVLNPLFAGIKQELIPLIEGLEVWTPAAVTPVSAASATLGVKAKPPSQHQSIAVLQVVMPIYAKALSRYTTTTTAQASLAPLILSLVWRGLVGLSHRPLPHPSSASTTPTSSPSMFKKGRALSGTSMTTPPPTPPLTGRFGIKLPASRPPSPPSMQPGKYGSAAADARALYNLFDQLPRPAAERPATRLAREAVDSAFSALSGLVALLESVQTRPILGLDDLNDLELLTEDIPTLITLRVLLTAYLSPPPPPGALVEADQRSIPAMIGLSQQEYREGCLGGFGRAEQCEARVGQSVLDVLQREHEPNARVVALWLEGQLEEDEEH